MLLGKGSLILKGMFLMRPSRAVCAGCLRHRLTPCSRSRCFPEGYCSSILDQDLTRGRSQEPPSIVLNSTSISARKPFRLSRYKSNEFIKRSQTTDPGVKPSGGSRQKQPFDPTELSRRLEIYQQDLKIAKARRLASEKSWESASETSREVIGQGEEDKQDTRNVETVEEEVVVIVEPERVQRPESIRQLSCPNARRVSSSRARRNPPGTYLPRYAAKQLSATTTPLQTKPLKGARKAEGRATDGDDATDVSPPMQANQEKKRHVTLDHKHESHFQSTDNTTATAEHGIGEHEYR
ncbi:hypothetical protein BDV97DRAFT_372662 [Delphinella strobiligena]|nr:hypothetical protein BDV97DRAFT_372662 [Delphinella strobiligena]